MGIASQLITWIWILGLNWLPVVPFFPPISPQMRHIF